MASEFPPEKVGQLLVACHRRCCICHRFCGFKMETDHIIPRNEGGGDSIENAIPVCFECHAEIHCYNEKHPRGRKYRPEELRGHREQWIKICGERPHIFFEASWDSDVGPLQSLIEELEFNLKVSEATSKIEIGCLFHDNQFKRAIHEGGISLLKEELKHSILEAYVAIGRANQAISQWIQRRGAGISAPCEPAIMEIAKAKMVIEKGKSELLGFLRSEV